MPDKQQEIEDNFIDNFHDPRNARLLLDSLYSLIDLRISNNLSALPKLKTLEEHNAAIYKTYKRYSGDTPQPNGIECPKCKKELLDSDPSSQLLSNPPQKATQCSECDYRGYRLT